MSEKSKALSSDGGFSSIQQFRLFITAAVIRDGGDDDDGF